MEKFLLAFPTAIIFLYQTDPTQLYPPRYVHDNEDSKCFEALKSTIIAVSHIRLSVSQGALERAFRIGAQGYSVNQHNSTHGSTEGRAKEGSANGIWEQALERQGRQGRQGHASDFYLLGWESRKNKHNDPLFYIITM
ncbi:hypothetical protein BofuT4_P111540.1 [Botrytis cinerea T4]|uniref:Uncharacterized protein n=1 Tax=Botryotinia fuckeliana (strain T4) TaxID=999810 RepID=G2Y689_BOTF4|nr:hypothetical protein BofuT4_P111540.1 [Botrytis cinerea T4]